MLKVIVSHSKISRLGVFSVRNIQKEEVAFILKGKPILFYPKTKRDALMKPNMIGVGKNLWIDPYGPARYINHSCNPNLGVRGKLLFVALRDIKKGEELTFDYSISEDSLWEMKCHCGAKNCRGIIRGIRWLPKDVYNRYLPYIPKYFQGVYMQYQS
ncbi:MAG: SET domain-containing protein [Minisyncoccota bacterium]